MAGRTPEPPERPERPSSTGTPPLGNPAIGVDQWVASHDARTEGRTGPIGAIRNRFDALPTWAPFIAFGAAAALLPLVTSNGYILRVGFDTLILMLLALGLNVVVGFSGLLDLGYVAFFGVGAYGYAMLASSQFGIHWPTLAILPVVTAVAVLVGFMVALPSRRLVGDYLAIVTLFFGQLFVTVTNNGEKIFGHNITNGPNGIANVDPFHLFGHNLESLQSYFYVALGFFMVSLLAIALVGKSRTGRAWRSLREDPLAAELMGMPVNRLKLYAFAFGAGVGGLTGTLFASLNTAVFSSDFDTPLLITVYAIVILGGAGSMGGVILGALVVNVSLEVLRTPNHATWVFFTLIGATLVAKLRPWRVFFAVVIGTIVFGFVVYGLADALAPHGVHGQGAVNGTLGKALDHWIPLPLNPTQAGNFAFVAVIVLVLVLTIVRPFWRNILLVPTLYLSVYAWDARLAFEPSITRLISIGVILIVLMNARPQGMVGTTRVEIV